MLRRRTFHTLASIGVLALLSAALLAQEESVAGPKGNARALLTHPAASTVQTASAQNDAAPDPLLDHPDIDLHHRALIAATLDALPAACRRALKHIYVRTDGSVERALGGSETILLNGTVSDEEFRALLIHEMGHITDFGCLRGSANAASSVFADGTAPIAGDDPSVAFYSISWTNAAMQRRDARPADFVSGYAAWDPFEDLAESYAYYVLQPETFRRRAAKNDALAAKLAWMEQYVFAETEPPAEGTALWTGAIPWDVTLLAYTWKD